MKNISDNIFINIEKEVDFLSLPINQELMKDNDLRYSLTRYFLLAYYPQKFHNVSPLQVYYNKYYWFMKFKNDYTIKYGKDDLNLRQEGFKILEEGERFDDIEWNIMENISNQFEA